MTSLEQLEQVEFLNLQYLDNTELIQRLQDKLLLDIIQFNLCEKDLYQTKEYIKDKVTLFRFLREVQFDFDKANARLLSTIQWRLDFHIADLTFEDCAPFFDQNALAFFHGLDNTENHPLLFVRLASFPTLEKHKTLTEQIGPYACLIMEMARKLTWDMTCDRVNRGESCVLVSQFLVVVNVSKAPFIPADADLIKTMGDILDVRFPGFIQKINVLNFGWLYQGVWSVLKLLLSEEAKQSIKFTSVKELQLIISADRIVEEMGGTCDYTWSMETDQVLQKYGCGTPLVELPNTPPLSASSPEICSSSSEDDVYFDAIDTLPPPISQPVTPLPPPPTTKLISPSPLPGTVSISRSFFYGNSSSWGADFLHSLMDSTKQQPPIVLPNQDTNPSLIIVNPPITTMTLSSTTNAVVQRVIITGQQLELLLKRFVRHLARISFGPNRGVVYWVLLYVFIRVPVEMLVKRSLMKVGTKRLTTTTIGITAAIAAAMSAGLSNALEKFKK